MKAKNYIPRLLCAGFGLVFILAIADKLDRTFPPRLLPLTGLSKEVVDRDGKLLRAFATKQGRWRLAVRLDHVDPEFVNMLIAYEDRRFWSHRGIDPLAFARAAVQFLANQRIVSGGSTITMQLARLLEPRKSRSISEKFSQILRALQIERRLSKREILELYLSLAPYGGNLEGVRAASLSYFGHEPRRLSSAEAALLVALPQLPELRRPDRNQAGATKARNRVLARMVHAGVIGPGEVARAQSNPVASVRRQMPALAAHLTQAALNANQLATRHQLTLSHRVQVALETSAREAAKRLGPKVSAAIILADIHTGEILGQTGSSDFFDNVRSGWIDMTNVARSPGSTLKPLIFGLALEEGLVAPETIIEDRPANFAGYRPRNFDATYQGDVSVRHALQTSLNVPAVRLLEAVGPARLISRMRRAGAPPVLPNDGVVGLAIGLGGAGVTLRGLVQLYSAIANGGRAVTLRTKATDGTAENISTKIVLSSIAAWHVSDMLAGVAPPKGATHRKIAYKTGTSYGYRDAWSVGYDGRYVVGVWAGRADNSAVPGLTGRSAAAPILFEAFARSGLSSAPMASAPPGAVRLTPSELPVALRRFSSPHGQLVATTPRDSVPQIVYPPQDARIELGLSDLTTTSPLVLKLQGGRAPFRWLANGTPLPGPSRRRQAMWNPDGGGYSTLTVIDATGRAASVRVFLE
jgi:penicillin-binding protein 1C